MKKAIALIALAMGLMPLPALGFSTNYHHWDYGNPTFVPVSIDGSILGAWITPIARSMSSWNNAGARFRFGAGSAGHVIAFKWLSNPSALAVTYVREWWGTRITDRDTDINAQFPWDIDGRSTAYDIQNIVTHELGHWLQLNDLYGGGDYWKTMYGYAGIGETYKRTLDQDDINGIKSLYGW